MVVGVATVELYIHGAQGLKEKRGVVRRVVERVRNRFDISVAEVDHMDLLRRAAIGMAVVSNDGKVADAILQKALAFIQDLHLAEVGSTEMEILHL